MNALTIALSAIRKRAWQSALTLVLFITGVAVATAVLLFGTQAGAQLERTTKGIDLVVGAKGSPLQLILCNVFHLDYPTGNIRLVDAERIARHRLVKASLPLALGDSWNGYRIVGSTQGYREWYELELKEGQWWSAPMEVVIGADVAAKAGLSVGSTFSSAHGLTEEGEVHGEVSYKVTGILQPTGTRQDQLILTGIRSLWRVHHLNEPTAVGAPSRLVPGVSLTDSTTEITSVLLRYRNPLAALQLPRVINSKTVMQAASPAFEASRLYSLLGVGLTVIQGFSWLIFLLSGFSVFISLYSTLQERQYDLAIMRTMGAGRGKVFRLILLEGMLLAITGTVVGMALGHLAVGSFSMIPGAEGYGRFDGSVILSGEGWILLAGLLAGAVSAAIPAWRASRTDIHRVLAG